MSSAETVGPGDARLSGAQTNAASGHGRPRLDDGTLETVKWIGLVAMTVDHVNTYVLAGAQAWMYHVGRLAMPLFGIVLAAHLARPGALEGGLARRMGWRLAIAGVLAQIPYTWLRGGPWPPTVLNILFLLLLVVAFVQLRRSDRPALRLAACGLLAIGGAVVEFWWIGAAVILTSLAWFRRPDAERTLLAAGSLSLLAALTQSPVPLLAPAGVYVANRLGARVPRFRSVFYVYYPAHLVALAVIHGRHGAILSL
jgi:TraX protein